MASTNNYKFSEISDILILGDDGIALKNIENNVAEFRDANDANYVLVRGSDAVSQNDFITKRQFDRQFKHYLGTIGHSGEVMRVAIGKTAYDRTIIFEYQIYNDTIGDITVGKFRILINMETGTTVMDREDVHMGRELTDIVFEIEDVNTTGENIVLKITNNYNVDYDILFNANRLSNFAMQPSQVMESEVENLYIHNLNWPTPGLAKEDVFVVEDADDNWNKRKVTLDYILDKVQGGISIDTSLPEKYEVGYDDVFMIEDSADLYRKKKVKISELTSSIHLDVMSFNA
jgi:hypothetical protein